MEGIFDLVDLLKTTLRPFWGQLNKHIGEVWGNTEKNDKRRLGGSVLVFLHFKRLLYTQCNFFVQLELILSEYFSKWKYQSIDDPSSFIVSFLLCE